MNKVLITGLGVGKALDLCYECNLNFSWLVDNPSTLLWADKILLPRECFDFVKTTNKRLDAIIDITLETLDKKNLLEKLPNNIKYTDEEQLRIYAQFLRDRELLLKYFPKTIKEGEDDEHKEFFIEDYHYCAPYIASLYGAMELANKNKAQCLFNKNDAMYLKYLNGIKSNNQEPINNIYSEIFSTLLPNESIIPNFAIHNEEKCKSCKHEDSCKEEYDNYTKTLNSILSYRNYDELFQARKNVEKIISKKGEIRDDKDVAEVISQFNEKKDIINKNIYKLFPKIKRWTNMVTLLSTPVTIGSGVLAALGNTNPIVPIISGSVVAIDEGIKKAMENYTDNNRWVSFLDKNA